jgi:hypothetical protein
MNNPHSNYVHKTKNKINHVVGIVSKSNRKIVETGKFYTPHTDMTGHPYVASFFGLSICDSLFGIL